MLTLLLFKKSPGVVRDRERRERQGGQAHGHAQRLRGEPPESGVRMIDTSIVRDGPLRLFRFADPDGNVIEYFSVVAQ